jgi:hypothetical protein
MPRAFAGAAGPARVGDLPGTIWVLVALASGTLLLHAVINGPSRARMLAVTAVTMLVVATVGGLNRSMAFGPGVIALLCSGTLFIHVFRTREDPDPLGSGRTVLIAVITAGIGFGAFFSNTGDRVRTSEVTTPMLILDPNTERAKLDSSVSLALAEVGLILERDLPVRQREARENEQWSRVETLARIQSRLTEEREHLRTISTRLMDATAPIPDPGPIMERLEAIERLVGAVRLSR